MVILGFFAATFGAALETGLSAGYTVAQYFGWQWGKRVAPRQATRFHTVVIVSVLLGVAVLLTTIDPMQLTEYTLVFSAVVLPLTYLPILVVANDRAYLGDRVNGRFANTVGVIYLVIVVVAAVAAIPLMIMTGWGMTDQPDPLRVDFHLLDRQIVDADGEPVGKVDDVELTVTRQPGDLRDRVADRPAGPRRADRRPAGWSPRRDRPPPAPGGAPATFADRPHPRRQHRFRGHPDRPSGRPADPTAGAVARRPVHRQDPRGRACGPVTSSGGPPADPTEPFSGGSRMSSLTASRTARGPCTRCWSATASGSGCLVTNGPRSPDLDHRPARLGTTGAAR